MSPYGLRQSPKPSKRVLEAGEQSYIHTRIVKKRKIGAEKEEGVDVEKEKDKEYEEKEKAKEKEYVEKDKEVDVESKDVEAKGDENTKKPSEQVPDKAPKKASLRRNSQQDEQRTPEIWLKKRNTTPKRWTKKKQSKEVQLPAKTKTQPIKEINMTGLRSIAATRGPQLTPDGNEIDVSPTILASPETTHTPYIPDHSCLPPPKHVRHLEKKLRRGKLPPTYTPFDIVSGGKPPCVTAEERQFWAERVGRGAGKSWEEEELPDSYGRLWRCIKVIEWVFQNDVGWDMEVRRRAWEVSPGVWPGEVMESERGKGELEELEEFEGYVERLLRAFGDEWGDYEGMRGQ